MVGGAEAWAGVLWVDSAVCAVVSEVLGAVSGLGTEWWWWLTTKLSLLMAVLTWLMGAVKVSTVLMTDWWGSRRGLPFAY
jgi:hypothetical protein